MNVMINYTVLLARADTSYYTDGNGSVCRDSQGGVSSRNNCNK